jgi:hypothetical protein
MCAHVQALKARSTGIKAMSLEWGLLYT